MIFKRILIIIAILSLILTINAAFAEEGVDLNQSCIYVSNDGSDSLGNGTYENPYQTIAHGIEKSSNNSNIYLKSGTYASTGYEITNKSISITGIDEVIIDAKNGEFSQEIFKINNGSSLILNNIKFINGYADLVNDTFSCIINDGDLYVNNCYFNNFKTINGVIYNTNNLVVDAVVTSNLEIECDLVYSSITQESLDFEEQLRKDKHVAEFITNLGNCRIYNSNVQSIYNGRNMVIDKSNLTEFISNNLTTIDQIIYGNINNSLIQLLSVSNCSMLIVNNSYINFTEYCGSIKHEIINSAVLFENSSSSVTVSLIHSNFTAISSVFNHIDAYMSNVEISYSVILDGNFSQCSGNINYNWWGNNKGYDTYDSSNLNADNWIVMTFEDETNSDFRVNLNKCTDGQNIVDLEKPGKLPKRCVNFKAESGNFSINNEYLINGTLKTSLIDHNPDTIAYATIDNQVLRLLVGTGYTNYTIHVSDSEGNDYFYDGSVEYPYKTLSKAVSKALGGNTIYIQPGNYTSSLNANLIISKDLTVIGLGNVSLLRPNAQNIFVVNQKTILTVKNINFTSATTDGYYEPFFVLNRGNLILKDCNFHDIMTQSVILSKNGDFINLDNVSFNKIKGQAVLGFAGTLLINNSRFSNGTPIYLPNYYYGYYYYEEYVITAAYNEFYIWVSANTTIVNSTFKDNVVGILGQYSAHYQTEYDFWNIKEDDDIKSNIFIYNSTFIDNNWAELHKIIIGLAIGDSEYTSGNSMIDGCLFYNNVGYMLIATNITNSKFINNSGISYYERTDADFSSMGWYHYPKALITAENINDSYFYGNSFLSKDYDAKVIGADKVYYSTFIDNKAGYGGALSGPSEVHYCVFINNSATYDADDIFVYRGDLNASSNWWGSNKMPSQDKVHVFIGKLTLNDWIIMSLDYKNNTVIASLDNLLDANNIIHKLNNALPSRNVTFSTDGGILNPINACLIDNYAFSRLLKNTTSDFNIYATIDNQNLTLTVYNNSTLILIKNMTVYGKDNLFNITLVNINGHRLSNQLLNVVIYNANVYDTFPLTTDSKGTASFNIDYPVGNYGINVYYEGDGYFNKADASSIVNVSSIPTRLTSYNYTYYGKNNRFYAVLQDRAGRYMSNQTLTFKIYNSNYELMGVADVETGVGGIADVLLSLYAGKYYIKLAYEGDEWYEASSSLSVIIVKPVNTTINLLNETFYGRDNDYAFTFEDAFGNKIFGETIVLTLSKGNESKEFKLTTDNDGVASINVNLEPGTYNVDAMFVGDNVYISSHSSAIINIQPIKVTFDLDAHVVIPENGMFTTVLVDMYGKRLSGENVTLDLYNDGLLKSYYVVTDGNGEANFKIDMPEGIYFAILNYNGNVWYMQATSASKITITPNSISNNINITGNDLVLYYGENKYFEIDFNDLEGYSFEGKIIQVTIASKDWFKSYSVASDAFGKARIQITLDSGVYNITYKYSNESYGIYCEGSNSIYVYKMPTNLLASDLIMNYGESQFWQVKLVNKKGIPLSNLEVNITVDNKTYNVLTDREGIAEILLDLELGCHNISYSFDNYNYESSNGSSRVLVVSGSQIATKITGRDIENKEGSLFNYSVILSDLSDLPIVSSEIILNVTDLDGNLIGQYSQFTNQSGVSNFNLNLEYGVYLFNTCYRGNDDYLASFNVNTVNIKALENVTETNLFGSDSNLVNGDNNTNYYVILSTVDGRFVKNQTIEFIVNDISYYSLTDKFGKAYLNVPFAPGLYNVISRFNGSDNLTKASVTNSISVQGELCYLYSQDVVKSYNNATQYYVALFDANHLPLSGKAIKFIVNNKIYERLTDDEGFACFDVVLAPGIYNITAIYQGNFADEFARVENKITVLTTIIGEDVVNYANANLPIKFLDNIGNPLSNNEVYFAVNNVAYKIKTGIGGVGVFNVNLKAGNYEVCAFNPLSGENKTFSLKLITTVKTSDFVKYFKSSLKFKATFLDKNGNPLKNANIKFTIDGKTYVVKTDGKGIASLGVNLKPGKYKIVSINTNTYEKKTNIINIKTIIITKNKKVKPNKKINFQAKILKADGKIAKKVTVKFKINKKIYKAKTNRKGIAKLNIKLKKGKYTVSTIYNGLTVKNKITVK